MFSDACMLVMACVDWRARVQQKTLSSHLNYLGYGSVFWSEELGNEICSSDNLKDPDTIIN